MRSNLEHLTVAEMRTAAAAWRREDERAHINSDAVRSTHDRIDELIGEIARLRDLEVTVGAVSPTLTLWRNPAYRPEDNHE